LLCPSIVFLPRACIATLQTGAGKTYSLSSIAADSIGMIPRAAAEIFSHIEQVHIVAGKALG